MDANGQRFWQLAAREHFPARRHVTWDARCGRLRLASQRDLTPVLAPAAAQSVALVALAQVPQAIDEREGLAWWDAVQGGVMAASHLPGEAALLALSQTPTDLCCGADGVLYVALPDGVLLHDLRGRWADLTVRLAGFTPWRLAPHHTAGVWVLEQGSGRLAQLHGRPLRRETSQAEDYDGRVFRPTPDNATPATLNLLASPSWPAGEVALALSRVGETCAVLTWRNTSGGQAGQAAIRVWQAPQFAAPRRLAGADFAYALSALNAQQAEDWRFAVRVPGRSDAPVFDLADAGEDAVFPLGEVYPIAPEAAEASFANGIAQPPHYPLAVQQSAPLYPLSLNTLAQRGEAASFAASAAHLIDSGDTTTVWHRLFAEVVLPPNTAFGVWLAATNEAQAPSSMDQTAWQLHGFGENLAHHDAALAAPQLPRAVREHYASELPGSSGLIADEAHGGLYSVLIQDSHRRVRSLTGRYLWLRVALYGDGRSTPELAALRAYGSRFNYVDQYLPRVYRESLFGEAARAPGEQIASLSADLLLPLATPGALPAVVHSALLAHGVEFSAVATQTVEKIGQQWLLQDASSALRLVREPGGDGGVHVAVYRPQASPSDFTTRLLANFEGLFTQWEDRVAAAHLYTTPQAVPSEQLDWLAAWLGVAFDVALPEARRRAWLAAAADLARWHGTRNGLRLALDLATGGSVAGGEIVVLEDFRLRRILATLLGVDLSEEHDPLLPGLIQSGNSIVGDTLVIGEQATRELMALFTDDQSTAAEDAAALRFDEQLAHRATVLVHNEVEEQDFGLIRRVVAQQSPAHVEVRVRRATWPLLVGIASLVGVDTYLAAPRQVRPVQVQRSSVGMGDFVFSPALLDPRLAGQPEAVLTPPAGVAVAKPRKTKVAQPAAAPRKKSPPRSST